ncbi:MAG: YbhB/YbcL family Raf kinase inhibitor-like protein [Candidatus Berkiellales bacterium]
MITTFNVNGADNSMEIYSSAFQDSKEIPTKYTCEGENISPPLAWKGVPPNAKSLALIVDDPDAPDPKAPKMVWVHWVVYNLDPNVMGLEEAMTPDNLPDGTLLGLTNWNNNKFGGPCPPIGRHRYYHKLYALDTILPELKNPTASKLKEVMKDHIVAEAVLMGTYQKKE